MKPVWTQTLAWILAVVAAVLLALSAGELGLLFDAGAHSHGANVPR